MGDVAHVIDYVNCNYAKYGIQYEDEGDGVVNFTMAPKVRGITKLIQEIGGLPRVSTVDQQFDGVQLKLKVYVNDGKTMTLPSGTVVVDGAWMKSAFRGLQKYMASTPVLIFLVVVVVSYYRALLRTTAEYAYMKAMEDV